MSPLEAAVVLLSLALALLLPTAVWFGIRIGQEREALWWEQMLRHTDRTPQQVALFAAVRRVTR